MINLITPNFYLHSVHRDRNVEILPGIKAFDAATFSAKIKLAELLINQFPVQRLEDGSAQGLPVTENFYRFLGVTGYSAPEADCPLIDNSREMDGMGDFATDRHKMIFRSVLKHFTGFADDGLPFLEGRSTGPPLVLKTAQNRYALWKFLHSRMDDVCAVIGRAVQDRAAMEEAVRRYGLLRTSFTVFREQPDKVKKEGDKLIPKERSVRNVEHVLTNGAKGWIKTATRTLPGFEDQPCFRMRRRVAYGVNGSSNMIFSFFRCMQSFLFEQFPQTYHIRTADDLNRPLQNFGHVCGLDCTEFDKNIPRFFFDEIKNYLMQLIRPEIIEWWYACLTGPILLTGLTTSKHDNGWLGDPFDPTIDFFGGNRSGIASTSYCNKLVGFTLAACIVDDYYHDVIEVGVFNLARHLHPSAAVINNGDDILIYTNDTSFLDHLRELNKKGSLSPYFKIDFEDIAVFGGKVLTTRKVGSDVGRINADRAFLASTNSFFVNRLAPERGWRNNRNGIYFDVALKSLPLVYGDNPAIAELLGILSKFIRTISGLTLNDLIRQLTTDNEVERRRLGLPDPSVTSSIDAVVYNEPDRLSWQYRINEVSAETRKALGYTVTADEHMAAVNKQRI